MPKVQTDYKNTIFYKLCCKDTNVTDIYVGHTTNFVQRKNGHKTSCLNTNDKKYNQYVYTFIRAYGGWDNWSMISIEERECKDKREAESIEHYWIEKLAATLNSNKPYAMCKEQPQLYKHCWYEEKKDYILEKAKAHYEENKDVILEKVKLYAEEHKEEIADYQKEYQKKNKEKIREQKKLYREEHKEESKIKHKEWREANKQKLKDQRSEIIACECGHSYTFGNKNRHLQTKVHINYQDAIMNPKTEDELKEQQVSVEQEKINKQRQAQKLYRETHAEQIKSYKKQHYEEHKVEISEQYKKYKEEHKEAIKEQQKIYVEENKQKIKEKKDEWYQKNKERILQKQKEMIVCECGAEIRKSGEREHRKSVKHTNYLSSII